jgi:hypothetical protein
MKFFFPDSQDLVDPSFDFVSERRSETRQRNRDDQYAHEVFSTVPYDGILVSKGIVDGAGDKTGKYSLSQRHRLRRDGVRGFFRLDEYPARRSIETMGDCGAFSYVKEPRPPFTVDDVIDFYEECGFDYGFSVDHVILGYDAELDDALWDLVPEAFRERQAITLELAGEFLAKQARHKRFVPVGVAQGWSPKSYAHAVTELQRMGYRRIALGGMVPLKSHEILASLERVAAVREPDTAFHLLGVTRTEHVESFDRYGVTSFDSTSPLRQAFKDDKDNYYTMDRTYVAVRVPQVEGNAKLGKSIVAGHVNQREARRLEQRCLECLNAYDADRCQLDTVLDVLADYERLYSGDVVRTAVYREVLADRPWKSCPCDICKQIGIHVILFRGAERNRRRGFHNVFVFSRRLHRELGFFVPRSSIGSAVAAGGAPQRKLASRS